MELALKNEDRQSFPAGFGHHPYFVRDADNAVQIEIACDRYYVMENSLPSTAAVPLTSALDFRTLRPLGTALYNDVLTGRRGNPVVRLVYPQTAVSMIADPLFQHIVLYTPEGKPFFAVEPQTNANDGFNLYDRGIEGSGVFVLQPGEFKSGTVIFRLEKA